MWRDNLREKYIVRPHNLDKNLAKRIRLAQVFEYGNLVHPECHVSFDSCFRDRLFHLLACRTTDWIVCLQSAPDVFDLVGERK